MSTELRINPARPPSQKRQSHRNLAHRPAKPALVRGTRSALASTATTETTTAHMAKQTAQVAEYAASCRYQHIPPDVVERAKQCVTDTVAAAIFGYSLPWSRMIVAFAERNGAGGSSRILGPNEAR